MNGLSVAISWLWIAVLEIIVSHRRVFVLGSVCVFAGATEIDLPLYCKPLISFMSLKYRKPVQRLEVASALWAEMTEKRARRCLSTAVWRLNGAFDQHGDLIVGRGPDAINIAPGPAIWFDVEAFQYRVERALRLDPASMTRRDRHRLARGLSHYTGDFSSGNFDDWVLIERQRLRALYLDGLFHLAQALIGAREYTEAIRHGRTLQALEPLREDVHCLLMKSFMATGNRAKALEQYRICQGELGAELGVEPMDSTKALYRELLAQNGQRAAEPPKPNRIAAALAAASLSIDQVRHSLGKSDGHLAHAQEMIRRAEQA